MSTRLQVLLEDADLRAARRHGPRGDATKKIAVVRSAAGHAFPAGDIRPVLADSEHGAPRGRAYPELRCRSRRTSGVARLA